MMNRRNIFMLLAFIPLWVFLGVAGRGNFTDAAWRLAFETGAALSIAVLALSFLRRVPVRDVLAASSLLLIVGGLAFLADIAPVLAVYKKFQGSVFIGWYLGLRLFLLLFPGRLSGYIHDPYKTSPRLAVGLLAVVLVWSFFRRDLLVSTVLPMAAALLTLSLAGRPSSAAGEEDRP